MPSRTTLGLLLLVCCALGLRVATVVALTAQPVAAESVRPVSYEHGEIAANLVAGRGFVTHFLGSEGPTSQQAPMYPALVSTAYWCFGVESPQAILAIQLVQCVVGVLLVLAVVWLGWALMPDRRAIGWVAGWGEAINPIHVYMVTHLQVALWAATLLILILAMVADRRGRGRRSTAIVAGLLVGILLLVEPILALALPVVGVMFWRGARQRAHSKPQAQIRPFLQTGVLVLAPLVVLAPWLARNYVVHGEFVFVKSTFGYAFWQGNNPSSWGTDKIPKPSVEVIRKAHDGTLAGRNAALWEARHETLYIDDVLLRPTGYAAFMGLSEPARSRKLFVEACDFIRKEPLRYAALCARRLQYFLLFDETNPKTAVPEYRMTTVVWLVLAFVGLLVARPHWQSLAPTMVIFAVVTLFHALTITSARFRIPLEPLGLLWGAEAIVPLLTWVMPAGSRRASPADSPRGLDKQGWSETSPEPSPYVVQGPHWRFRKATCDTEPASRRVTDV